MAARKLSKPLTGNGGTMLGQVFDDDSDCENVENGSPVPGAGKSRSSGTGTVRRRSSFGGARFKNEEEQARIVNMYANIIKLSSENKINEKNSWGLDLIDHMGKLIKADSSKQRGVNFQKASCTLDASIKIYANRVDDTYSLSHRVLESFSRNADGGRSHDSDEENADPTKPKRAARVGASKASSRLNIGDTIEKNIDNINAKELEHDVQLDPMFHTISKLFDKGGMEGMLMYNLRVNPYTSSMALNQDGLENPFPVQQGDHAPIAPSPSSSSSGSGLLDLTALINASQLTMADLSELTICPQLGIYRTQIHGQGQVPSAAGEGTINTGSLNPVDFVGSHFRNVETTDAPLLGPSVHSLTRDLTVIPFADMSAEMKTHTFANPAHAYFDGMAAMIAPVAPVPDMGLFNKEVAYDYADNDDVGDIAEAVHGNDIDDCDEDGNYVASERRATMAPAGGAMSSEEAGMSNKHNARQSMLQVTDVNGKDDSVMPASKIQWGAVNGNVELTQADLLTVPETALHNSLNEVIASGAVAQETGEYAFFDISALMAQGAGNDWAGAKHWKRGAARATRASTRVAESSKVNTESSDNVTEVGADADESATGKKGSKASRSKKTGLEIDFIALAEGDHSARCYPAEILFKAPVSRSTTSNTTLMTAAAISKQNDSADAGEYFLPVDSKLLPKDLCRLFLVPRMVVPPAALSHMIKSSGASTKGKDTSSLSNAASQDLIWGQRNVDETSRFGEELPSDETADMQYGAADDLDYDNDDLYAQIQAAQALEHSSAADALAIDDALPDTHPNAAVLQDNLNNSNMHVSAASSSLTIDESKLVKAGRKVGKIDIGYSSVAKRINVKQLKVDIWQEIAQLAGVERENIHKNIAHESEENENAPPAADFHATVCQAPSEIADKSSYCDGKQMSFQGLVNDLALRQKQKDVSVSFYFICLLHLANEKTLKITDNDCLDDLIVSKD